MKNNYSSPELEINVIDTMDIITTSDWTLPEVPVGSTEQNAKTFNW